MRGLARFAAIDLDAPVERDSDEPAVRRQQAKHLALDRQGPGDGRLVPLLLRQTDGGELGFASGIKMIARLD